MHAIKVILVSTVVGVFLAFVVICIDAGWTMVFYEKYEAMYEIERMRNEASTFLFLGGFGGFLIAILMLVRGD